MRAAALEPRVEMWQPYAGLHAERCAAVVAAIAARAAAWVAESDTSDARWTTGPLGPALLLDAIERVQPDEATARALATAVRRALSAAILPRAGGLAATPVGSAAALAILSRGGQRFAAPLATVDRAAREHAERRLADAVADPPSSSSLRDLDLLSGGVGMLAWLQLRAGVPMLPPAPALVAGWRRHLAAASARLAQAFTVEPRPLVYWGVARGVAGLAACATPGSDEERSLLALLDGALAADRWGPLLPVHTCSPRARTAWSHGVPGVVAALGRRLLDGPRGADWRAAVVAIDARPLDAELLDGDDGLGRGLAGVLHSVACAAALTGDPAIAAVRDHLLPRVLVRVERRLERPRRGSFGFVDGLSGIGAVLHAARTPGWPAWHPLLRLPCDADG